MFRLRVLAPYGPQGTTLDVNVHSGFARGVLGMRFWAPWTSPWTPWPSLWVPVGTLLGSLVRPWRPNWENGRSHVDEVQ